MFVLLPTIGWAWPALLPLAGAVASALGYQAFSQPKGILRGRLSNTMDKMRREVVPLDAVLANVIAEELGNEERLMFKRDEIILIFRKDARGKFFVEVSGPAEKTALDLKMRAEEFAAEMVKKFAYHRIAEQLTRRGAVVFEETVEDNGRVTMKARQWR